MKYSIIYITIVSTAFAAMTIVFATFPRSTYSELEKRELATFPEWSTEALFSGQFTKDVSAWFSDSEPYRDFFMTQSMKIKDYMKISLSDEDITIHASEDAAPTADVDPEEAAADSVIKGRQRKNAAEENAKIANRGIIVVGKGENVRALMAYGGSGKYGKYYADAANKYKEVFGDAVNVYCMPIPTAIEFYCPEKVKKHTNPQLPTIKAVFEALQPTVKAVNIHAALAGHTDEDIYLRTDHHWAPLGGYYAAREFAQVAGVPFKDLSSYEQRVVHGYVGSMYGYSKDISVKNAPEDFVYHIPRNIEYTTTYIDFKLDKDYKVIGTGHPHSGQYFMHYKDGSGGAYCTFMGSDAKVTQVRTNTGNGRRVMILKDSFGNTIPGYLFYSFEEVHVVDFRYFTLNMKEYVKENKITDILFANNIFNVCSPGTAAKYVKFLNQ